MHTVTLIPGDGIGPEITAAMRRVVTSTGVDIDWEIQEAGEAVMESEGTPLPDRVIESIKKNKVAIKGPITTPVGTGFRSINVAMRKALDLYINLRPAKSYGCDRYKDAPGAKPIDIVIFRENTEDLYAGIEFEMGSDEANELRACIEELEGTAIRADAGISIKPISEFGTRRIVKAAFDYALANDRKKVTCVHKANIMKHTDGLFLRVAREVAEEYADTGIEFEDWIIDAACMRLVVDPSQFDVMVMPNLAGDILSDLCAGLVGGLGIAPGANIGDNEALFEPVHGSAPRRAGQGIANPTALILTSAMMLRHLGEGEAAAKIENAVNTVLTERKTVTYDLGGEASTEEYADALIAEITR
ncbi:MAG: isocitrate/isopropylmalate dehydrogenase family protein [Coriobacteriia bacterium]|nr:isocitrate/isopropylmalate dehydrogenase family protein [Coriobacteriia bacterium]